MGTDSWHIHRRRGHWFAFVALFALLLGVVASPLAAAAPVTRAITEVTPKGPTFNDNNQSVYIPSDAGVRYHIAQTRDGARTELVWPDSGLAYAKPGTYAAAQGVDPAALIEVWAVSAGGSTVLTGVQSWVGLLSNAATKPAFHAPTSTITVPKITNVEYRLADTVIGEEGLSVTDLANLPGDVTVTAVSTTQDHAGEPLTSFTERMPAVIAPKGPTFNDQAITIQIPSDWGIRYTILANGTPITKDGLAYSKPATYGTSDGLTAGQNITVTATTAGPDVLLNGTTTWNRRFALAAPAPTFDDAALTVTLPLVAGIAYRIDGSPAPAGVHPTTSGASITVTAWDGDTNAGTWTHTYPTHTTPKGPTFNDSLSTVAIPSDLGVRYTITAGGATVTKDGLAYSKPGTYSAADGLTTGVAIVVTAAPAGSSVVLQGQTTWNHTLATRPGYSLAGGDEFNDPSYLPAGGWTVMSKRASQLGAQDNTVYRTENITVKDGELQILTQRHCLAPGEEATDANASRQGAVCPAGTTTLYSSGRMSTDFIYGTPFWMEVRARMSADQISGMHFAAWIRNDQPYCSSTIRSSNLAELDTMEIFTERAMTTNTSHITCTTDGSGNSKTVRDTHLRDATVAGQWHTYGMTYDGYAVRYTFDGQPMLMGNGSDETTAAYLGLSEGTFRSALNDHPWQMIIDSLVFPKNTTWINPPRNDQPFPARIDRVDYVRMTPLADVHPAGAVGQLWRATPWLGSPTSAEEGVPGMAGARRQAFDNGTVYWSAGTGAHAVKGGIEGHYSDLAGPTGSLGLPTSEERSLAGGASQTFQGGQIHWSAARGAYSTRGAIQSYWAGQGWENGWLGYPTSEEITPLAFGGASQTFQGGTLFWDSRTGAVNAVKGAILGQFGDLGWEGGWLGYPRSDERALRGGASQSFENGQIHWSGATGAHSTKGAIQSAWAAQGWENGQLGYPTSEELPTAIGVTQTFQGGRLTWNARSGQVSQSR